MFSIFKKLAWFFKLRWKSYLFGVFALITCAILTAATPRIVGNVIDQIANGTLTAGLLFSQIALIVVFGLIMYVLRFGWRTAIFGNSTLLESIMRNRLFKHFTQMDANFFHKYRTGDLMAHATNDLAALRFVAGGGILTLTDSISISAVTIFSMVFLIDWKLTLLTILPFPLLIITSRVLGKKMNQSFRYSLEAFSKLNDQVQESISGVKVVKAFGEEKDFYQDYQGAVDHVVETNQKVYKIEAAYSPVIEVIIGLTYVLTLFVGTFFVQSGRISIGDLVAYFSYLANMTWPLLAVGNLVNTLERGNASWDRVEALLDETSHIVESDKTTSKPLAGQIDFAVDEFTYPDEDQGTNIRNVHFRLEDGQTLGIAGRTGSGKTTLFKLLLREYDHYKGHIRFNDEDIKNFSLDSLSQAFGYVPQDNFLFSDTIRENIRFANPKLSQEEVEEYAKLADIHDDIMSFPLGYDTQVGEKGVSLSGGQKQRISIARALAVQPEYLILDDSLSAVDAQTEERILNNLKSYRAHKTTLIAAHRLSSLMHADEILVMDDGQVIERGQHQQLVAAGGWYAETYSKQQLQAKLTEEGDQWKK
ncbi:ABC transporter ATP-binding protein [Aerococcus kribbianus]|uniref:ABC transporter transmembrane domain-containing protein n=1 Tax=Aerococcus kribbianus TaxID=2999064 RepID=A0A9X3FM43_9LACT|nr:MULTISPECIES: ABC transporter transmembrane domain-containing protein [unclassified Aerococcus]MCZ0716754.1 ABC transporter transmembrane domain-containing protein [Aerococcus sp. YH-aer221]MCZ0725042.1 ABC transporter transmembrane domain-containing protein [Aerococcus sp. YH-aer222]